MVLSGYFSESVVSIITTKSKLNSQEYIERIIKEEVVSKNYDLFYESVSTDGVVISSFDVNKANIILSDAMGCLRCIADKFNEEGSFDVRVPISYLFIPSSYFLSDITLNVKTSSLLFYDVKIKTNIEEYGINSSIVTLSLQVEVSYQVIVPLMFEVVDNYIDVLLAVEVINGKVPEVLFSY